MVDIQRIPEGNEKVKFFEALKTFLEEHPVTLNGKIPKVKDRKKISDTDQRKLYTHWGKMQFEMRVKQARGEYLISYI